MEVILHGKGTRISLNQNDFTASGGEGSIYIKNGLAFKIYNDYKKMIPLAKIRELSTLTLPRIIKPQDVLLDEKNNPIGFTMRQIKNSVPLCQVFTKSYRDRNNITRDTILNLVMSMREGYSHIHQNGCLIVDGNEMNFLVDDKFTEIIFIDVDSYQTKSFPATALMESVRDRHTKGFNQGTDWFAFAIVSFQMMVGIHPYKGKYPAMKSLEERMSNNVSVFHPGVTIPAQCYPLTDIPDAWKNWYISVFEKGERSVPPAALTGQAIVIITKQKSTSGSIKFFDLDILQSSITRVYDDTILCSDCVVYGTGTHRITRTSKEIYLSGNDFVSVTPQLGHKILVSKVKGEDKVSLYDLSARIDLGSIPGTDILQYDNRVYIRNGMTVVELDYFETSQVKVTQKPAAFVMENSSKVFDGVITQSILGAQYVSIFPSSGVHHQIRISELDGLRIVDAKFDNNVLVLVGFDGKKYDRFIIKFSENDYKSYDIGRVEDISYSAINFVCLPNGICILINESDEIEIFSGKKGASSVKVLSDPNVTNAGKLFKRGTEVLYAEGGKLSKISMN